MINERGFLPGPDEEEKKYKKRIEVLERHFSYPPEGVDYFLTDTEWDYPLKQLRHQYGIAPDWIVAHYDNRRLPFFQAGATWIQEKEGISIPLVQIKTRFAEKEGAKEEILLHESVHAARMAFNEPQFEELLAYQTSRFVWRRWLGALFQYPWESYLFIFLLLFPLLIQVTLLFFPEGGFWEALFWAPWIYFAWLLTKAFVYRITLLTAARRVKRLFTLKNPWHLLIGLTDKEIWIFAWMPAAFIEKRLKKWKKSFRWKVMTKAVKEQTKG